LKPVWSVLYYHSPKVYNERMDMHKEALQNMHLNDLYADEKLVGNIFDRDEL